MWKTLFRICLCHIEAYLIAAGFPGWRVDADVDVDVDATDPMSQFRVYSTRYKLRKVLAEHEGNMRNGRRVNRECCDRLLGLRSNEIQDIS